MLEHFMAPANRQVSEFFAPYNTSFTPYTKVNFSEVTDKFCKYKQRFESSPVLKVSKIIILGDVCVGKTSIINRFCCKLFQNTYKSTIGVDFQVECFDIMGILHNIQIWDTAGQERFKSIAQSYYRSAHVIITVFDLSFIRTLYSCKTWLEEALKVVGTSSPYIFLVGSKKDLLGEQAYLNTENLAANEAVSLKAEYWPVSSKTGENIDNLFYRIACLTFDDVILKYLEEKPSNNELKIGDRLMPTEKEKFRIKKKERCDGIAFCN